MRLCSVRDRRPRGCRRGARCQPLQERLGATAAAPPVRSQPRPLLGRQLEGLRFGAPGHVAAAEGNASEDGGRHVSPPRANRCGSGDLHTGTVHGPLAPSSHRPPHRGSLRVRMALAPLLGGPMPGAPHSLLRAWLFPTSPSSAGWTPAPATPAQPRCPPQNPLPTSGLPVPSAPPASLGLRPSGAGHEATQNHRPQPRGFLLKYCLPVLGTQPHPPPRWPRAPASPRGHRHTTLS